MAEKNDTSNPESSKTIVASIQVSIPLVPRSRSDSGGQRRSISFRRSSSTSSLRRRRTGSMSQSGTENVAQAKGAWVPTNLVLTETKLYYDMDGVSNVSINLVDVIGVQIIRRPPPNNPCACEMDVNYYPLVPAGRSGKQTRKLSMVIFQFDSDPEFRNNLITAMEWKKKIKMHIRRAAKAEFCCADSTSLQLSEDESLLVARRLLVFINPVGGQGKGVSDFKQHVQPLFDMAEINCNMVVTERANHARDIMKEYDVTQIDGIVISSGDGLLYEVINGLMEREDWEVAIKTPIGMLPTGSGNAMVASTLHIAKEEYSLMNAAFQIIRGGIAPLDVATVQTGDGGKCYMTLLANWGLCADVDIESEKFRKIGETRFVLGALNCIIKKRLYKGRLSYLPSEESTDSNTSPESAKSKQMKASEAEIQQNNESTNVTSDDGQSLDQSDDDKPSGDTTQEPSNPIDQNDGVEVNKDASEQDESNCDSTTENVATDREGAISKSDEVAEGQQPLDQSIPSPEIQARSHYHPYGPEPDLLSSSLSEAIPDNWKTLDAEFIGVIPTMIPCMAHGFYADPSLPIGSGNIRILILETALTRMGLFSLITGTESGKHIGMDGLEVFDVKAYRLEPLTAPGMLTLDGEEIFYGPHQVQIHSGLARIMCRIKQKQS